MHLVGFVIKIFCDYFRRKIFYTHVHINTLTIDFIYVRERSGRV